MNVPEEEQTAFEIGVVVPKRSANEENEDCDCVGVLVDEFRKAGLIVERVQGIADEFIKLAAPLETLGRAAAELQLRKRTHIGMDLQFEWEEVQAFVRQPDGSLFSWCERFHCYHHLIYGIVNKSQSTVTLKFEGNEYHWKAGENIVQKLESEDFVKQVFPLHDEVKRKNLLKSWALHWWNLTNQPIDEIYSYFGTKIAIYFAFLGMFTQWMLFPAAFAIALQLIDFGSLRLLVLPVFFIGIILWAVIFSQFWKRKNSALLARFGLTAFYILSIQHFTRVCGKISVKLIKRENNETTEKRADSLVYKVFGLYFMQSYIGIFYHALLHRNFLTLRQVLIQRLLVSQVFENLLENTLPYLKYSYKKYRVRDKKKREKGSSTRKIQFTTRVEKEYMKSSYSASIGEELEDGLFDDFLELALQFGMIMMFACAFPLAFAFAALNNITEIKTDALKLLTMFKRPVPRAATTIGAWLNIFQDLFIFQFLIVLSICTNCALLVWLYDQEGNWSIEPGLAAILVMEHILLLIKFGVSRFVPEEPAWVRASRVKNATQAQDMCSKQLLRTICVGKKVFGVVREGERGE
ncbi:anoctamin-like protein At1g73020 isoform X3 [Juglans microcarpa x Juglans regia]|uniref:anoctamin-like protein At1g73020 isoform X3 n=1 Tax=Juglans microcarpa x Juglans regia TaxID=2249226 RepID=UPI001B7E7F94|nr:anoctamin-like protein At1g73020 isoform X3 [Juglans microcarpa x Juglans regia]